MSLTPTQDFLRGRLLEQERLAEYTSWRVGGPADYFYVPADVTDTTQFLKWLPKNIPLLWLGLGSNVLIREQGVEGAVILTLGALNKIEQVDTYLVRAEAGVSCAQMARFTARLGLSGLEFMAGIPGTVGGALAMNAGCYGGETWQRVKNVEVIHRSGEIKIRPAHEFEVGYRHVKRGPDEWFVAALFELTANHDKKELLANIHQLLEKRNASQPTGLPNCGSVFRNPPNNFAARLIEQSGLKGFSIGNARVSEKHANFIINEGNASATDIEKLIFHIAKVVEEKQGVRLVPEVCILGKSAQGRSAL